MLSWLNTSCDTYQGLLNWEQRLTVIQTLTTMLLSKVQSIFALSTWEAEYVAMCEAEKEAG